MLRLDPPRQAIIELRTPSFSSRTPGTRTFGFFRCPNEFFALFVMRKSLSTRYGGAPDPLDRVANGLLSNMSPYLPEVDCTTDVRHLITP
ncbi:hypothetical protein QE368_000898 [Asaia bogorensis NBRC 16594]|nr:hypothetical protein [Asaia bogorensis NBRC 16594]